MTFEELVNEFKKQDLKEGDLVEVEFTNGDIFKMRLSYFSVVYEEDMNSKITRSYIYLQSPFLPFYKENYSIWEEYETETITRIVRIMEL